MERQQELATSWYPLVLCECFALTPFQVRLVFGSSPNTSYNEHNAYNLFVQAFDKADFESSSKGHLPRRILGYMQERLG